MGLVTPTLGVLGGFDVIFVVSQTDSSKWLASEIRLLYNP